jgi:phosphomevalonate kinase
MALVMCDVDCGSQTVGMVKKVLEWRSRERDSSTTLWDNLQAKNDNLATALQRGVPGQITEAIAEIRAMIRRMGEASGVPIEPPEQTALLDAVTEGVEGVYGGVVPGAGGYDAVVLVVRGDEDTLGKLRSFLREWSSANGTNVNLLDVKGEMQGARYEKQDAYHLFL